MLQMWGSISVWESPSPSQQGCTKVYHWIRCVYSKIREHYSDSAWYVLFDARFYKQGSWSSLESFSVKSKDTFEAGVKTLFICRHFEAIKEVVTKIYGSFCFEFLCLYGAWWEKEQLEGVYVIFKLFNQCFKPSAIWLERPLDLACQHRDNPHRLKIILSPLPKKVNTCLL